MDDKLPQPVSNQERLGKFIAEQMENIEHDFDGEEYLIGDMVSIVEVILPGEEIETMDGKKKKVKSYVRTREATPSLHAAIGLVRTAERLLMRQWGFDTEG